MIIIHDDKGTTYGPRVYTDNVDRRKRLSYHREQYALGRTAPNYPVPVPTKFDWSKWYTNDDGFWGRPEVERRGRTALTLRELGL